MKTNKIRITEKWVSRLKKHTEEIGESFSDLDLEINFLNYLLCNISEFIRLLHMIVDIDEYLNNKEELHNRITNNDFTVLMFLDILEIV